MYIDIRIDTHIYIYIMESDLYAIFGDFNYR